MPNSRIEASNTLTDEQLQLLGVWVTTGNNLLAGGGQLLGSKDNYGWFFISNNIARGGFFNTGEFFLCESGLNADHRYITKPLTFITNDETEQVKFTFVVPDDTVYNFSLGLQFKSSDNVSWGRFRRSFTVKRDGLLVDASLLTYPETERINADGTEAIWRVNNQNIEMVVKGIAATNIQWTGIINYQGVY